MNNDMQNDPVYMNPARRQVRDQAVYQMRMTNRVQYVLQVNAQEPGAGYEYSDDLAPEDVVRLTDLVTARGEVIDLTPLRGLAR